MRHFFRTSLRMIATALLPALLVTMFAAAPAFGQRGVVRISAVEKQLFDLVNQERQKARLKPYMLNAKLCTASRKYCEFMANANQVGHQVDGRTPSERVKAEGYPGFALENFGGGQASPEQMVRDWMASTDGHRKTILSNKDTEIGVGNARSADGTNVWILVAGKSAEARNPPQVIVTRAKPSQQPATRTQQDPQRTNLSVRQSNTEDVDAKWLGDYEVRPVENDWHVGTITRGLGHMLKWTNRAGVSWKLSFDGRHRIMETGNDNPYYNHDGGKMRNYQLKVGQNGQPLGFQFGPMFFYRVAKDDSAMAQAPTISLYEDSNCKELLATVTVGAGDPQIDVRTGEHRVSSYGGNDNISSVLFTNVPVGTVLELWDDARRRADDDWCRITVLQKGSFRVNHIEKNPGGTGLRYERFGKNNSISHLKNLKGKVSHLVIRPALKR